MKMSGRSKNCGCGASGKKTRSEGSGLGSGSYYADKENKMVGTRTVRERVTEETSGNTMFRSVTYSEQTTYSSYPSVPQGKPSATRRRQPLTDVNETYSSQRAPTTATTKRPLPKLYPSTLVTSTARRPGSAASSKATRRAHVPLASSTQPSATSSSSRGPRSPRNDSELACPTAERMRNVTLRSRTEPSRAGNELRSLYSALSNDDTWLTCKTADEESFMPVPHADGIPSMRTNSRKHESSAHLGNR